MLEVTANELDLATVKMLYEASYGKFDKTNFVNIDKWDVQLLINARAIAEFAIKIAKENERLYERIYKAEDKLKCYEPIEEKSR